MSRITTTADRVNGGRAGARSFMVWDPLVRLIHWTLVLSIVLNGFVLEDESALHNWVGYLALGLVGVRLLWGLVGPRHARFSAFPPNPAAALRHMSSLSKGGTTVHLSHNPLGALMVYNIWATVLFIGATGYMMGMVRFFGVEWVEVAHELAFNWLLVSVALHVGGVIFDSWRSGVPLVKSMLHGRKEVPENRIIE